MESSTDGKSLSSIQGLSLTISISGCLILLLFAILHSKHKFEKLYSSWLLRGIFLPGEFHLYNKRGTVGISLQIVTIVVICNYSCTYSYLLIKWTFWMLYTSILHISCIYSVFILIYWISYLFLCIVNQYMYPKFKINLVLKERHVI